MLQVPSLNCKKAVPYLSQTGYKFDRLFTVFFLHPTDFELMAIRCNVNEVVSEWNHFQKINMMKER